MEISEQVGMTPEIIQKVIFPFTYINYYLAISFPFSLAGLRCVSICIFSVCSSKTKLLSSLRKERRYYLALLFSYIIKSINFVVLCNTPSHSFNCFTVFLQRGKTVPEELVRAEDLSKYRQVATHAVSIDFCLFGYKLHFSPF